LPKHPHLSELSWVVANEETTVAEGRDPETGEEYVLIAADRGQTGTFKFVKKAEGYEMIYTPVRPVGP
jgi:hypothetical protein